MATVKVESNVVKRALGKIIKEVGADHIHVHDHPRCTKGTHDTGCAKRGAESSCRTLVRVPGHNNNIYICIHS